MIEWDRREPVKTPAGQYHAMSFRIGADNPSEFGAICGCFGRTPEHAIERRTREEKYVEMVLEKAS